MLAARGLSEFFGPPCPPNAHRNSIVKTMSSVAQFALALNRHWPTNDALLHMMATASSTFADKKDFLAVRHMLQTLSGVSDADGSLCRRNFTVVMGGLNDGQLARVMLKACPQMTLHGFEILPTQFRRCAARLKAWPFTSVHNAGLSERSGTQLVTAAPNGASEMTRLGGTVAAHGGGDAESVRTVALDDFARDQHLGRVDFAAIDTEGHDASVLRGMRLDLPRGRRTFPVVQYEIGGLWTGEYDLSRQNASKLAELWAGAAAELIDRFSTRRRTLERHGRWLTLARAPAQWVRTLRRRCARTRRLPRHSA